MTLITGQPPPPAQRGAAGPSGSERSTVPLVLWACALSLCWLLPSLSALWATFDLELTCAAVCLALGVGLVLTRSSPWQIPRSALFVATLAAIPFAQYGTGKILFFGDAWMAALYLLGFALAIVTGRRAAGTRGAVDALFLAVIIAAAVSVGLELVQWLDIKGLDPWVRDLPPTSRPFANLAQPNNLSTLLCWGLVGLWHAFLTRGASGRLIWPLAALLLFGIALAQSRTAWLVLSCFLGFAVLYHRPLGARRTWRPLALLAGFFVLTHLGLTVIGSALAPEHSRTLHEQLGAGTRLAHWKSMIAAIGERFWTGWGWEQVSVAQQAVAPSLPPVPELLGYSHDLFLDLLVWNGVPIGAVVIASICAWLLITARRLQTAREVLLLLAVVTVLVHSLLEYPHAYAFFLLPTGLMIGALSSRASSSNQAVGPASGGQRNELAVARPWVALGIGLLAVATTATVVDYLQARSNFDTLRFETARIGPNRHSKPPKLLLLTQLQAVATADRTTLAADSSDADFELLSKVSRRFPSERALMHFAALSAARGDLAGARSNLVRLCKLYPVDRCDFARKVWSDWSASRYPWLRGVAFPASGDHG